MRIYSYNNYVEKPKNSYTPQPIPNSSLASAPTTVSSCAMGLAASSMVSLGDAAACLALPFSARADRRWTLQVRRTPSTANHSLRRSPNYQLGMINLPPFKMRNLGDGLGNEIYHIKWESMIMSYQGEYNHRIIQKNQAGFWSLLIWSFEYSSQNGHTMYQTCRN